MRFPGAQVRRHFHLDNSLAQVGLGQPAAKVHFLPDKCACPGLTGLPETDTQRVDYIGLFKKANNLPFTQTLRQTKPGASFFFFLNKTIPFVFFFNFIYLLIDFWLYWVFVAACERGLHFVVVRGLLIAVASLVAEHRL